MIQVAVFWTIAAATLAWAFGDACRLLRRRAGGRAHASGRAVRSRSSSIPSSAFVLLYDGSHGRARRDGTTDSRDDGPRLGSRSVRQLPVSRDLDRRLRLVVDGRLRSGGRFSRLGWARVGFFLFMFVNGAVIFADGWMRTIGLCAVIAVTGAFVSRAAGRSQDRSPALAPQLSP